MISDFHLAAIVKQGKGQELYRIPLHQDLQNDLAKSWGKQLDLFRKGAQEIEFNMAYKPEDHECFVLSDFSAPSWLVDATNSGVEYLEVIKDKLIPSIVAIAGFAEDDAADRLVLFQNFNRSHVIDPQRYLYLFGKSYNSMKKAGLSLDTKLAAVYQAKRLFFRSFYTVNTFLPLADQYKEASNEEIRDILGHAKLETVDVDALVKDANQWFRKRFAILRDSGVLDKFSARQIKSRSKKCGIDVKVKDGKVVFPAERSEAKKLLQFLNEELYRGLLTNTLYETNSKRVADNA